MTTLELKPLVMVYAGPEDFEDDDDFDGDEEEDMAEFEDLDEEDMF